MHNLFCAPRKARDLFWNVTRAGEVNVQPCPGGASGIAKWRCTYTGGNLHKLQHQQRIAQIDIHENDLATSNNQLATYVVWQPHTPDLTQCRSLWLSSLELRVNQRDAALISISNELSQVCLIKKI